MAGTRGRDKGEFTNLQGISASSNGRIVVADSNNQCIQVIVYYNPEIVTLSSYPQLQFVKRTSCFNVAAAHINIIKKWM